MSVHPKLTPGGAKRYVVRWREGDRNRSRAFTRRRDADAYDAEVQRRRQLGPVAVRLLDSGAESLDCYVSETWAADFAVHLAPRTRSLYDAHISPFLGSVPLRELTPDRIARWQAERVEAGAGTEVIRKSHTLSGNVLQRAVESERIATNPQRVVRKVKRQPKREVRPLAPVHVEAMLAAVRDGVPRTKAAKRHAPKGDRVRISQHPERDAALIAVLAYAGLRPGEALALTWRNVGDRTLTVNASKTGQRRSVRLLGPLAVDLKAWRLASSNIADSAHVFPAKDEAGWTKSAYESWGRRVFAKAAAAAGREDATPYTARHSFASLLLHEGGSVIYVARQLGHGAGLTLSTYGHVIEELDGAPQLDAEAAIRAARGTVVPSQFPSLSAAAPRDRYENDESPASAGPS